MDKAKVLEIIEPSSDLDGKIPISSFDSRKLRTDSLDDADDFPEKEVFFRLFYITKRLDYNEFTMFLQCNFFVYRLSFLMMTC